jgi:hypothetical protein
MSVDWRAALMPLRGALVSRGRAQQSHFVKGAADKLHGDGSPDVVRPHMTAIAG